MALSPQNQEQLGAKLGDYDKRWQNNDPEVLLAFKRFEAVYSKLTDAAIARLSPSELMVLLERRHELCERCLAVLKTPRVDLNAIKHFGADKYDSIIKAQIEIRSAVNVLLASVSRIAGASKHTINDYRDNILPLIVAELAQPKGQQISNIDICFALEQVIEYDRNDIFELNKKFDKLSFSDSETTASPTEQDWLKQKEEQFCFDLLVRQTMCHEALNNSQHNQAGAAIISKNVQDLQDVDDKLNSFMIKRPDVFNAVLKKYTNMLGAVGNINHDKRALQ